MECNSLAVFVTEVSVVPSVQESSNFTIGDQVVLLQDASVSAVTITQESSEPETSQKHDNSTSNTKVVKKRKLKFKRSLAYYTANKKIIKPTGKVISSSDDSYSVSSGSDQEDKLPLQKQPQMGLV